MPTGAPVGQPGTTPPFCPVCRKVFRTAQGRGGHVRHSKDWAHRAPTSAAMPRKWVHQPSNPAAPRSPTAANASVSVHRQPEWPTAAPPIPISLPESIPLRSRDLHRQIVGALTGHPLKATADRPRPAPDSQADDIPWWIRALGPLPSNSAIRKPGGKKP